MGQLLVRLWELAASPNIEHKLVLRCRMKPSALLPAHTVKQKTSLAKSGLTSLATAAGCTDGVSPRARASALRMCVRACACVCACQDEVTWLLSWAVREDPALCCHGRTNGNHRRWSTDPPSLPTSPSPMCPAHCVLSVCHAPSNHPPPISSL